MDYILKKKIETEIKRAELEGFKIENRQEVFDFFCKKLNEGFKLEVIAQKLKDLKYDLKKAAIALGGTEAKAEEALAEVDALKKNLEKKEKELKQSTLLGYTLAAAILSGVGAYTAITVTNTTKGIETVDMMGTDIIGVIIKVAWLVCVIGAIAAVVFAIVFFSKLKKGAKNE